MTGKKKKKKKRSRRRKKKPSFQAQVLRHSICYIADTWEEVYWL